MILHCPIPIRKNVENLEKIAIWRKKMLLPLPLVVFVDQPKINENQRKNQYVEMQ